MKSSNVNKSKIGKLIRKPILTIHSIIFSFNLRLYVHTFQNTLLLYLLLQPKKKFHDLLSLIMYKFYINSFFFFYLNRKYVRFWYNLPTFKMCVCLRPEQRPRRICLFGVFNIYGDKNERRWSKKIKITLYKMHIKFI